MAVVCNAEARPNYKTCLAHEYLDQQHVLVEKVKVLANLLRQSKNCVAYTGAGISTSAGISDYATKTTQSLTSPGTKKVSPLHAQPTITHYTLTQLHSQGILKHWVQCNHDGLPQKAGYPQQDINEIHGGWFDPSNPVVPMSGTLRSDLIDSLVQWEQKVDLCLALGTSLCGMNADRMTETPASKAKKGKAIGTVVISIQCTQFDPRSCLRIFAKIDTVMELLAKEMNFAVPTTPYKPALLTENELSQHIFPNLPYNANGEYDKNAKLTLKLTKGSKVKLVNQPDWDKERVGEEGEVVGFGDDHISISFGSRHVRSLGLWWIDGARAGKIPIIPVVNK
jgi:NAD-dependent SIR2 family protein deacetylase